MSNGAGTWRVIDCVGANFHPPSKSCRLCTPPEEERLRDELARVTLQRDLYKKTAEQLQAALDMLSRGGA